MKSAVIIKIDRKCCCKSPVPILHQVKEYWYCMICERKIDGLGESHVKGE